MEISTLTCLLKMSDNWHNGLDLGKLVGLVFIDLKKAFDTVDHDILCEKFARGRQRLSPGGRQRLSPGGRQSLVPGGRQVVLIQISGN